ncbi:hypothetical protein MW887_009738 [Aspergillus wentii]|nr:hypothetical protein MW887_009738 [Aspergillus wentii]
MPLLKRETIIPIPQVHAFHAGLDNSLEYPFILMDFVDGIPLFDVWFDQSIPPDLLDTRWLRVFEDIAKAMMQLGRELDLALCAYNPEGAPEDNEGEDSPEELQGLRKVYLEIVERALSENNPSSAFSAKDPTRWTRRSWVIQNLKIAADDSIFTHRTMIMTFDK